MVRAAVAAFVALVAAATLACAAVPAALALLLANSAQPLRVSLLLGGVPWWAAVLGVAAADLAAIAACGALRLRTLQALLANVCVVAPANILISAAYAILTPLRLLLSRLETMYFTRMMSHSTLNPTFWSANFSQLLDAFQLGYKTLFDLVKGGTIPTDDILAMPAASDECRGAIRAAGATPYMSHLRAQVAQVVPPAVAQSFLFRLALTVAAGPLAGWWLVDFTWIPLIRASGPDSGPAGNAVKMRIPKCKYLTQARGKYGEETGWASCNNCCKLGMEEMFSGQYGILSCDGWEIRPDRATGSCTAVFGPPARKGAPVADIEDLQ